MGSLSIKILPFTAALALFASSAAGAATPRDIMANVRNPQGGLVVVAQTDVLIFSTVNATLGAAGTTRLVHLGEFRARACTRIDARWR